MKNSVQAEGESVQEAVDVALQELGVGSDEVEVEIIEEANKGLLGLRKGRAKVLVTVKDHEQASRAVIEELIQALGIDVTVESYFDDDELWMVIKGESLSWLIGHHGRTLDALQVLVGAIVNKRMKAPVRVTIDVEGYRAQRKQEVRALAETTIDEALAHQEAIALRPMSAMERKTVHMTAGQHEDVTSMSEGVDPERYVVITPAVLAD